jgi:hypothetical protein
MKWIPFLLILIFTSIHCFSQINCCSQLSKEEIIDLKAALQKAAAQEDNPYFLALYKEVYLDSVVRICEYEGKAADSITVGKKIQDILKHNESYDVIWFYIRGKRGYKVIANSGFRNYVALYPALGYQSKI